jgi:hypothetical protein
MRNEDPYNHSNPSVRRLIQEVQELNQRGLELDRMSSREASSHGMTDPQRAAYWLDKSQNSEAHAEALEAIRRIDPSFPPTQGTYSEELRKDAQDARRQAAIHIQKSIDQGLGPPTSAG